ncbi:MAG: hypothetical protein HC880_01765 [Bacteroidia bacterium]|nr:hypothetical protein [Bacteroidia bacterium]
MLLIPQMILSGIIFRYENMNKAISEKGTVPLLADLMVSRWAFEAIMVDHYIHNRYERDYYELDKIISEKQLQSSLLDSRPKIPPGKSFGKQTIAPTE